MNTIENIASFYNIYYTQHQDFHCLTYSSEYLAMYPVKKIVILTSGGDAPGMNAAIRAAVRTAINNGIEVFGSLSGYQGLVNEELISLKTESVANIIQLGGTILKTARCVEFYEKETRIKCCQFLKKKEIDGLIVIGGDGSFRGATLLHEEGGPHVIGVPATIDNDIVGTEYTLGFDTARNTALGAIDKIRDTASSHHRDFMVEVMGRHAGFLAVDVGLAGGAEFILTPEFPMTLEQLAYSVSHPKRKKQSSIIVVAEGDSPGHTLDLAKKINQLTNKEYKVCILGHTQRGGSPTALDREMASRMGAKAVGYLLAGKNNQMVARVADNIVSVNFPDPKQASRQFNDQELIDLNDAICQ